MTLVPRTVPKNQELETRVLYTDGSYDNGFAGWAVVENMECIYQDWGRGVDSNAAEGYAILSAVRILKGAPALILSDSQGWVNSINTKYPLKGRFSKIILEEVLELTSPDIRFQWIPGHTNYIPGNSLCDSYAKQARLCRISTVG